jgi:thiol-disulfide isomerase/thioredoxin
MPFRNTVLTLAVVSYAVLAGCSKPADVDLKTLAVGPLAKLEVLDKPPAQPAGEFSDKEGGKHTLAEFKGKVAVVNYWATWCAPCVKEMPALAKLAGTVKGKPVAFTIISVDKADDKAFAVDRLNTLSGGAFTFYADPSYAMVYDAAAAGLPTTVIYGKDGVELARLSGGDVDWAAPEATKLIEAALAK